MSNNLIIVPVYPPDFHWAEKLLDSASSVENIALGFTNQKEADAFQHPFPLQKLISSVPETEIGFIGKKKLDLLKQAYPNYKYITIIDVECKFLKPVTTSLEEIWDSNCFVANHSVDGARIMKELSKACGYDHNDDLYPWFNCIPVFKTDLLPGFFSWIDNRKEQLHSYLGFEFLVFAVYCRYELNMPWRVLEGNAWHGLVENGDEWSKSENKHLLNQVVWSTYQKDIENNPNIKMLFHLDRFPIK
jgi:hypothetical protein